MTVRAPGAATPRRPLDALLAPRSIAVVGASASPGKPGFELVRCLERSYATVYSVHPDGGTALGRPVSSSIAELTGEVDLAVLAVGRDSVLRTLDVCGAAGVGAAVVIAGGFAETGADGAALQLEVARVARSWGMRLLGPNTSGFFVPDQMLDVSFVPGVDLLQHGPVSVVAQSGGVNHALCFLIAESGFGIRLGIGLGNAADVGFHDLLEHLVDDDATQVIALAMEGVQPTPQLRDAIERAVERKPVIALPVGRGEVGAFATSHTGAILGDWQRTRAFLHQAGAVVVTSTTDLLDSIATLAVRRLDPSRDPGIGVVTGQAGPALLATDRFRVAGLRMPPLDASTIQRVSTLLPPLTFQQNPVDTGRSAASFPAVIGAVASDPGIDALLVYALAEPSVVSPDRMVTSEAARSGTVIVFATGGSADAIVDARRALAASHIATFSSPDRAATGLVALAADARARWRLAAVETPPHDESLAPMPTLSDAIDEDEAKSLIEAVGLRSTLRRRCDGAEAAVAAAHHLGWPVVVKVLDSDVLHKSDRSGVHLNLHDEASVRHAVAVVTASFGHTRVLVEEQVAAGPELLVGASRDAGGVAAVVVGLGGIHAEAFGSYAVRVCPVRSVDAHEMLDEMPGRASLTGTRGAPAVDFDELASWITALSRLMTALPEVDEIDLNPVIVTPSGLVAVDAMVVRRHR